MSVKSYLILKLDITSLDKPVVIGAMIAGEGADTCTLWHKATWSYVDAMVREGKDYETARQYLKDSIADYLPWVEYFLEQGF